MAKGKHCHLCLRCVSQQVAYSSAAKRMRSWDDARLLRRIDSMEMRLAQYREEARRRGWVKKAKLE